MNSDNNYKSPTPSTTLSASTNNDTPSSIKIIRKGKEEIKKQGRPKSFVGKPPLSFILIYINIKY